MGIRGYEKKRNSIWELLNEVILILPQWRPIGVRVSMMKMNFYICVLDNCQLLLWLTYSIYIKWNQGAENSAFAMCTVYFIEAEKKSAKSAKSFYMENNNNNKKKSSRQVMDDL